MRPMFGEAEFVRLEDLERKGPGGGFVLQARGHSSCVSSSCHALPDARVGRVPKVPVCDTSEIPALGARWPLVVARELYGYMDTV